MVMSRREELEARKLVATHRAPDMGEVAADQAQLALTWQRRAALLAGRIHIQHAEPGELFSDCRHLDCQDSRRMFDGVKMGPRP